MSKKSTEIMLKSVECQSDSCYDSLKAWPMIVTENNSYILNLTV